MFKGKFSLLFFFTVFVTFLFFFNTTNEASSSLLKGVSEHLSPIIEKIDAGPGIDESDVKKQKLAEKIFQDYAKLKTIFESKDSPGNEMAKILGKKAILVVGSEEHIGKKEISKFWNAKKEAGYQLEGFTLEWAFIVSEEKITEEMEDYDHIAYESFTFTIHKPSAGKILKNQDGRGGRSCRHIHGCECRTR
jgi:hypothetical protein